MRLLFISLLFLSACMGPKNYKYSDVGSADFIAKNQRAAESLNSQLTPQKINRTYPLIIATVVNMNQLSQTSTFGRLVSEQVAARFTQLNFQVIETKLRSDLLIKQEGEFLLTRELKDIAKSVSAQAVIVGTYVENDVDVYINLKVVQPQTNQVLAATSYAIPKAKDVRTLLKN
jgi:TolB-like protein